MVAKRIFPRIALRAGWTVTEVLSPRLVVGEWHAAQLCEAGCMYQEFVGLVQRGAFSALSTVADTFSPGFHLGVAPPVDHDSHRGRNESADLCRG